MPHFICRQFPVLVLPLPLLVTEIIFVFAFWQRCFNEVIPQLGEGAFSDVIHADVFWMGFLVF
jgi:hypothetical protein